MKRKEMFKKFDKINPNKDSRILLITHNDLDGSGPVVVLKNVFKNLDVKHVGNGGADSAIAKSLDSMNAKKYDYVFITDISCSDKTAKTISNSKYANKYVLLDHHPTVVSLNKYNFIFIASESPEDSFLKPFYAEQERIGLPSGTSLMLDFCYNKKWLEDNEFLNDFAFHVQAFDTWDWKHVFGDFRAAFDLNSLFWSLPIKFFDDMWQDKTEIFNSEAKMLLDIYYTLAEQCWNVKKNHIKLGTITVDGRTLSFAYVIADNYLADLYEYMEAEYPDIDIYIIDTGVRYSLRTRKDDINIGDICKRIGGGGHAQAAGCSYDDSFHVEKLIENFKSLE